MREHPILFSAPMVRALLADRKTMTRRALNERDLAWLKAAADLGECGRFLDGEPITPGDRKYHSMLCRYGEPGDRLWVRETFATLAPGSYEEESPRRSSGQDVRYSANPEDAALARCNGQRWRPSIHMPRWASRLLLEVTEVRIERLQTITDEDAISEGIEPAPWDHRWFRDYLDKRDPPGYVSVPQDSFRSLWQSINGIDSWDANPWVWVIEFRRILP